MYSGKSSACLFLSTVTHQRLQNDVATLLLPGSHRLPVEPHQCTRNFCLSYVCRVCCPAGEHWTHRPWISPQLSCKMFPTGKVAFCRESWLSWKWLQIFSDLSRREVRCTHRSGVLCVYNNNRQHQALVRDKQRCQRYVGLHLFFYENHDATSCTGNRCIREV